MKRYLIEKKNFFLINVIYLMVLNYVMFWIKLKIILKKLKMKYIGY